MSHGAPTEITLHGSTLVATIHETRMRDMPIVQRIREEIAAAITSHNAQNVVLDLREVEFVGSVAFLAFLGIRRMEAINRIIVCNLHTNVREIFILCKLIPAGNQSSAPFEEADSLSAALLMLE